MCALGDLPPIDFAVHADTGWERDGTYWFAARRTRWLEEHGVRVITVRSHRTRVVEQWESRTEGVMIPAYTLGKDGKRGQLRRQCTSTWKIRPIRQFLAAELKGRGLRKTSGIVTSVQGISQDEWTRMRESDVQYVVNEYPLVDARLTRQDCIAWLEAHELPVPVKSACVFCPYHQRSEWKKMARVGGHDWEVALRVDRAIRNKRGKFPLFVHPLRLPLDEAVYDDGQLALWPEPTCDNGYCHM